MDNVDLESAVRTVADRMPIGAILTDRGGRIRYANRQAELIFGVTEDELSRNQHLCAEARRLVCDEPGPGHPPDSRPGPERVLTRYGCPVYLDMSPVQLSSGPDTWCLVAIADVTGRVRLERRFSAQHELSNALIQGRDLLDVLHMAVQKACDVFDATFASITMPYPSGHGLTLAAVHASEGDTEGAAESVQGRPEWPAESVLQEVVWSSTARLLESPAFPVSSAEQLNDCRGCGFVVPIRSDEMTIGVLSIAVSRSHPSHRAQDFAGATDYGAQLGRTLALSLHHLEKQHRDRRSLQQMGEALENRVRIEQAKGLLAGIQGISTDEAFLRVRAYAKNHNRPIHSVAADVVARRLVP